MKDPVIQECRLRHSVDTDGVITQSQTKLTAIPFAKAGSSNKEVVEETVSKEVPDDISNFYEKIDKDDDDDEDTSVQTVSFEVNQGKIESIQKRCIQLEVQNLFISLNIPL